MNSFHNLVILFAAAIPAPAIEPLTIGSPCPKLAPMAFLRGEAVKELSKGTVYVVEFSGTQCLPCLKCVPHLNELQKKYPAVVFISLYGEEEKVVREFLDGRGKEIAFRVAAEPSGAMWRDWSDAAHQEGIPHAFIVGKDAKIAWIGHPGLIAEPLGEIVAGTFDPREEIMRLKVEQTAALRLEKAEKRRQEGLHEYNRINDLIKAGKLQDALADTEKAFTAFQDCPSTKRLLRDAHFYLVASLPGRREEAFKIATEYAVEAKTSKQSTAMTSAAAQILNAAEGVEPGVRDRRLIDLALVLLRSSPAD